MLTHTKDLFSIPALGKFYILKENDLLLNQFSNSHQMKWDKYHRKSVSAVKDFPRNDVSLKRLIPGWKSIMATLEKNVYHHALHELN